MLVRDGSSRCAAHPRQQWTHATPVVRITGRKLQRLRAALFARQPLCEDCQEAGRVRQAEVRDHRIPLAEGGLDNEANEQALCKACHAVKSQREAQRGRRGSVQ